VIEFDVKGNIESARNLIQQGLRIHEEDPKAWIHYFKFEMNFIKKLKQRHDILTLEVSKIMFNFH
jgi:hypothetical protein